MHDEIIPKMSNTVQTILTIQSNLHSCIVVRSIITKIKTVLQNFHLNCQICKYLPDTIIAIYHIVQTTDIELLSGTGIHEEYK